MSWLRKNWRWGLFAAALVAGMGMFFWFALTGRDEEIQALRAQLQLKSAVTRVKGLEAERAARKGELRNNEAEAKRVRSELLVARKKAIALVQSVDGMTELEVMLAYKKLGY